jgi:hypothetical protein
MLWLDCRQNVNTVNIMSRTKVISIRVPVELAEKIEQHPQSTKEFIIDAIKIRLGVNAVNDTVNTINNSVYTVNDTVNERVDELFRQLIELDSFAKDNDRVKKIVWEAVNRDRKLHSDLENRVQELELLPQQFYRLESTLESHKAALKLLLDGSSKLKESRKQLSNPSGSR